LSSSSSSIFVRRVYPSSSSTQNFLSGHR
jgi:hypothetical protein